MTPSQQCKESGLASLSELVRLVKVARSTLIDWHKNSPDKFSMAIDAALYRKDGELYELIKQERQR